MKLLREALLYVWSAVQRVVMWRCWKMVAACGIGCAGAFIGMELAPNVFQAWWAGALTAILLNIYWANI